MKGKKDSILRICSNIQEELNELLEVTEDDFDELEPNDWWNELYKIADKIVNLQQGKELPTEIWMDNELPTDNSDEISFEYFMIDVQYVERGLNKITDWVEKYYKEQKVRDEKPKEIKKPEKKEEKTTSKGEEKSILPEKEEKEAKLTIGPISIPISKEQGKFILIGFVLGFISAILTIVIPLVR